MANWNKLTAGQFKAIKTLLRGGATQKEAAEYMQVSVNTAFWVNKAETFEEYQHMIAESHLTQKRVAAMKAKQEAAQKVAAEVGAMPAAKMAQQTHAAPQVMNPTVIRVEATHYMMQEMQKTNELLKLISNKLAFIVDELCGTGKKEG